jgi:hypothetical protein
VQQVRAAALDRVATGVEHVAALRERERAAGVLLDHDDPDAESVQFYQLVEDDLHRLR